MKSSKEGIEPDYANICKGEIMKKIKETNYVWIIEKRNMKDGIWHCFLNRTHPTREEARDKLRQLKGEGIDADLRLRKFIRVEQ